MDSLTKTTRWLASLGKCSTHSSLVYDYVYAFYYCLGFEYANEYTLYGEGFGCGLSSSRVIGTEYGNCLGDGNGNGFGNNNDEEGCGRGYGEENGNGYGEGYDYDEDL